MAGEPRSDSESDTEELSALLRRSLSQPPHPWLRWWPSLQRAHLGGWLQILFYGSQILEVGVAGLPREADLDAAAAARLSELRRRCPGYFGRDATTVHKGRLA